MPQLSVSIKNGGKTFPVTLDTDAPPAAFKQAVYDATGIPIDRMKVMVKGGILKVPDPFPFENTGIDDPSVG
jgi:ubiquitin carboxyl-terminal hydrolase 14